MSELNSYSYSKDLYTVILLSAIVNLSYLVLSTFEIPELNILKILRYILILYSSYLLVKSIRKRHLTSTVSQRIFILWIIIIYVHSIPEIINPTKNYIHFKQFSSIYALLYVIPLFMIAKLDMLFLQKLIRFLYVVCLIYVITAIPQYLLTGKGEGWMAFANGVLILLMTFPYYSSKYRKIILMAVIIAITIAMLDARRNKVLFFGGGLVLSFINILYSNSTTTRRYKVQMTLVLISMFIGIISFYSYFELFFERIDTGMDSRKDVVDLFFMDFDRTPMDWIFGRGIYGQIFGGILGDTDTGLRDGIENGYLTLILKGGWIWLGLLIIISLRAIFKGLFKSRNLLCRGFGFIVILYYIDMIGYGIPSIGLKYFMVFISIAGCNNEWLRSLSDEELKFYLHY